MEKPTLSIAIFVAVFFCLTSSTTYAEESGSDTTNSPVTATVDTAADTTADTTENTPPSQSPAEDPKAKSAEAGENSEQQPEVTEKTSDAPPEQAQQAVNQPSGQGEIARAQFTTAIQDREPTDDVATLSSNNDKIYFFTELVNFNGATITHRWEYQGKTMAEVNFNVGGSRWRAYSSKNIKPEWTGVWSVTVLNEEGIPLKMSSFEVITADSTQ